MASLNKVILVGNLTRDPDLRRTPGGASVCNFGMAMNRSYTTAGGEEREEVCFVDVEAWGSWADACSNYLRKGSPVLVEGRLRYDQWEDRETGRKRSKLLVTVERGQFLGQPARGGDFDGPQGPPRSPDANGTLDRTVQGPPDDGQMNERSQSSEPAAPSPPPFMPVEEPDDDIPF